MSVKPLNHTLYTDLPIDEMEGRLALEELETRLELDCWANVCATKSNDCDVINACGTYTK